MRYLNVYFRLEPKKGISFNNEETLQFFAEITGFFQNAGWKVRQPHTTGYCPEAFYEKNRLYLHPTAASGHVAEDMVENIERILRGGKLFYCYKTDITGDVKDWSDDEYREYLKGKEPEIRDDILNVFRTKRRNLFVKCTEMALSYVRSKHSVRRITGSTDVNWLFINELFEQMVCEGAFVLSSDGGLYRTKTKKEATA